MNIVTRIATIALAVAAATGLAACSGSHSLTAKVTCGEKVISWYGKGGKADLKDLASAAQKAGTAGEAFAKEKSHTEASGAPVLAATKTLSAAITRLGKNPVPGCVPGASADVQMGLADFSQAVTQENKAVTAAEKKDTAAAQAASKVGGTAAKAGSMRFLAAARALKTYLVGH